MLKKYRYFLLTVCFWSIATVCSAADTPVTQKTIGIIPEWLYLTVFCCLGAFVLHCKLRSENQPMIEFLKHLFPKWESSWRTFLEACFFAVIGGIVSYGLIQPITTPQALSAGLGWTGLISAFSSVKSETKV